MEVKVKVKRNELRSVTNYLKTLKDKGLIGEEVCVKFRLSNFEPSIKFITYGTHTEYVFMLGVVEVKEDESEGGKIYKFKLEDFLVPSLPRALKYVELNWDLKNGKLQILKGRCQDGEDE